MATSLVEPQPIATLHRVSWRTYESLLKDYAGYRGVHLNFDRGVLEIMTPGPDHENVNIRLEHIIVQISEEVERDFEPYGSTTFKRPDLERGFEPDSCFYIEQAEAMRGRTEIDLTVDPAPDLVIEIDGTSSSLDKLPLYASVGVREVWRYRNGSTTIYSLSGDAYAEREQSLAFPELSRTKLEEFIAQAPTMRRPEWLRGIREWARAAHESWPENEGRE